MSVFRKHAWGAGIVALAWAGTAAAAEGGPVRWMAPESLSKAQLESVVSVSSGLSKADSKRVLDGFINATTKALASGNTLESRVGRWEPGVPDLGGGDDVTDYVFGVFSLADGGVGADGCPEGPEVVFKSGNPLFEPTTGSGTNPIYEGRAAGENPLYQECPKGTSVLHGDSSIAPGQGNGNPLVPAGHTAVLGTINGDFDTGDLVVLSPSEDLIFRDYVAIGTVAGVLVKPARGRVELHPSTRQDSGENVGLLLRGIDKKDIRRGMAIARVCPPDRPVRCDSPVKMVGNAEIVNAIVAETRLPGQTVSAALQAALGEMTRILRGGGFVDLEGFGRFSAQTEITVTVEDPCAGVPENCPPTSADGTVYPYVHWSTSVTAEGASPEEIAAITRQLENLAERAAQGMATQGAALDVKAAAKKKVRFKAGAELSDKVN